MKMQLNSEQALANFLNKLGDVFDQRDKHDDATLLHRSAQFVFGSSSEFLGEAYDALNKILRDDGDILTDLEHQDIHEALAVIRDAFQRAGRLNELEYIHPEKFFPPSSTNSEKGHVVP
jgi:hypothetical protein